MLSNSTEKDLDIERYMKVNQISNVFIIVFKISIENTYIELVIKKS